MKNKFTWISFFMSFMLVMNVVANSYLPKRVSKLEIRNERLVKKTKKVLPEKYKETTGANFEVKGLTENVKELDTPVAKEATNVSDAGFTANWEPVKNAEGYAAYALLTHKATVDEQYYLMNEDFHRIDFGTIAEPELGGMFDYLDNYVDHPDWIAYWPVYAEGVIGVDNSLSMFGIPGTLLSPFYDLSKDGGKVTVSFKARGTGVNSVAVSLIDKEDKVLSTQSKTVTGNWSTLTFNMTDGNELSYISIMIEEGDGMMFIDDLKVSQNLKAGESVNDFHYAYMETLQTSQSFLTPDKGAGDSYSFMVAAFAFYEDENGKRQGIQSEYSQPKPVKEDTSIDATENNGTKVYVMDNLHVELAAPAFVAVYTANGRCIRSWEAQEGDTVVRLAEKGVYLVKVGNEVFRVIK